MEYKNTNRVTTNTNSQSILLYNTQNVDAELLIAGFSIRKKEYQRIWKDIQTGTMTHPETHYLIQGVRGSGKTTLLSRLAYEVSEDEDLNKWLISILLNEEEYGILSLFTFWLRIAEKLSDYNIEKYTPLYQRLLELENDDSGIAWELIRHYLDENGQKIIVFVDNLGELFQDFDDIEHAQLREALSLHPQIRLIGGSSQLLEAHYDGNAPFYQFFKLINLKSISEEEMHELLRSLAKQTSDEAVTTIEDIITNHPERIEAVRRLTDGVPRTIVLLFQIIMEGAKESSYAYLEETIDKTTPLYKHRMDDLSRQQKAIVHAIAMNWDAMSAKEIAEKTRLPSKTVSAQLVKLQKQRIVDKIETDTKNHLYIIKERFFNIWYLMRYGRESDRRRVLWLTRFLEGWYDRDELNIRLIEIAMPYIDIDESKSKSIPRTKDDYINALLASSYIDENIKFGVNSYLEPYYKNLITSYSNYDFDKYYDECLKHMRQGELEDAKQSLKELLNLKIGISELLYCLEISEALYNQEQSKSESITSRIIKEAKKSNIGLYSLLINIMENDLETGKKLGYDIVNTQVVNYTDTKALPYMIFEAYIRLWFDELEEVNSLIKVFKKQAFNFSEGIVKIDFLNSLFTLMLEKGQLEIMYNIMTEFKHLKEQFKPFYYATVSLLKDERRQEYLRMGSELQSTVDEILKKVEDYRVEYG